MSDLASKPPKRAVLLVNIGSRRGAEWFEESQVKLRESGVELVEATSFKDVRALISRTKAAVKEEVPLVIVGGGDGTLSAVAPFFVNCKSVLGVLPLGTGNAFARDLGIPAELEAASQVIATGNVCGVDLGKIGDRHFINVATVGLTTLIAKNLTDPMKKKLGRFVYAVATTRALAMEKPFVARIETEHGTKEFATMQVVIGNGRFHAGPFPLSPDAMITSGKLVLYALASTKKSDFLKLALLLPTGYQGILPEVYSIKTDGGKLTTFPSHGVTVDGEICMRTPAEFSIAPLAVRVMTPLDFKG